MIAILASVTPIALTGLTKRFGAVTAVDAIDLRVGSGELFFLLGPSGCGKTTVLRMIAGFIAPTAGRIAFGDKDVTSQPPNRRNTGMVFQSYALWPHMSVQENVAYGLDVRKVTGADRQERVEKALHSVHMHEYAKRKPNELSGGQQQRVALARALVIEPTVLLLDEPLSNLDAKLRLEMRSEIKRICTETKITTVYVTHDQKEALSMADTVAVLRDGSVCQVGPPRTLYDRPASRFVADFLGETNFIAATVRETTGDTVRLDTAAGSLTSSVAANGKATGASVTCSIRPETVSIGPAGTGVNQLSGRRVQTVFLGEMAQHVVELDDGSRIKTLELNPRNFGAETGERVSLSVAPEHVVVLES
jgi:iron(III) transport system ATP-binding protein